MNFWARFIVRKPLHLTDANFESEVLKSDKPVLVDFWAAWCGPCRMMNPVIEELAKDYDGVAEVGKLNVDENSNTAAAYGVRSIPTVLLFKDGKVAETFVGVGSKQQYEQALGQAAVAMGTNES